MGDPDDKNKTGYKRDIKLQLIKDYNSLNAYVPGTLPKSPPGIVPDPGAKSTEDTSNGNMGDNPSNILVDETQYPIHIAGKGNAICKRQSNTSRCWAAALSSLLGSTRSPPAEQSDLEQINVDLTENGIVQAVRNKQATIGRKLLGADDGSLPDALRNNEIPFVLTAVFNLENPIHL